jgi:hypothetical protein
VDAKQVPEYYFPGQDLLREGDFVSIILMEDARGHDYGASMSLRVTEVPWPWLIRGRLYGTDQAHNEQRFFSRDGQMTELFFQDDCWNMLLNNDPTRIILAAESDAHHR